MLEISILGSGSSGNCAVVRIRDGAARTTFLLDAGLSAKQIRLRLARVGLAPEDLDGILLTHEHGDHTRGIDVLCRHEQVPIYCSIMTREVLVDSIRQEMEWNLFESGEDFELGGVKVGSFPVPHDAVDPLGFLIGDGESTLGVLSDVGHVTKLVTERLSGATTLFVEANYDETMLHNDTKRPWATKQRISSRHGHLSNDQAADLVGDVANAGLRHVVLGHLSSDCNDPAVASGVIVERLRSRGYERVGVRCACPREPMEWLEVAWPSGVGKTRSGEPGVEEGVARVEQGALF
ncbi:MAG: MBL fold metallo-hydrolase [Verrucomicrobiota bacterium]